MSLQVQRPPRPAAGVVRKDTQGWLWENRSIIDSGRVHDRAVRRCCARSVPPSRAWKRSVGERRLSGARVVARVRWQVVPAQRAERSSRTWLVAGFGRQVVPARIAGRSPNRFRTRRKHRWRRDGTTISHPPKSSSREAGGQGPQAHRGTIRARRCSPRIDNTSNRRHEVRQADGQGCRQSLRCDRSPTSRHQSQGSRFPIWHDDEETACCRQTHRTL